MFVLVNILRRVRGSKFSLGSNFVSLLSEGRGNIKAERQGFEREHLSL